MILDNVKPFQRNLYAQTTAREENGNAYFTRFGILDSTCRHDTALHGPVFHAGSTIVTLMNLSEEDLLVLYSIAIFEIIQ